MKANAKKSGCLEELLNILQDHTQDKFRDWSSLRKELFQKWVTTAVIGRVSNAVFPEVSLNDGIMFITVIETQQLMFCSTGNSQHEKQTSSCGQEGYFVNRGDLVVEGWGHIDQSGSYSPLWAKPEVNTTTSFCQLSSSFTSLFNILAFTFNSSTFF